LNLLLLLLMCFPLFDCCSSITLHEALLMLVVSTVLCSLVMKTDAESFWRIWASNMCFIWRIVKVSIACYISLKLDVWISIPEMSRKLDLWFFKLIMNWPLYFITITNFLALLILLEELLRKQQLDLQIRGPPMLVNILVRIELTNQL
jgi:hypothetical protein